MPTVHTVTEKESRANDSTLAVAKNLKQQHHHLKFKSEQDIAHAIGMTNRLLNPKNLRPNTKLDIDVVLGKKLPAEQMRELLKVVQKDMSASEAKLKQSIARLQRSNGDLEEVRRIGSQYGIHLTNEDVKTIKSGSKTKMKHATNQIGKGVGKALETSKQGVDLTRDLDNVLSKNGVNTLQPVVRSFTGMSSSLEGVLRVKRIFKVYEDSYKHYVSHDISQGIARFRGVVDAMAVLALELVAAFLVMYALGKIGKTAGMISKITLGSTVGAAIEKIGAAGGKTLGIGLGLAGLGARMFTDQQFDSALDKVINAYLEWAHGLGVDEKGTGKKQTKEGCEEKALWLKEPAEKDKFPKPGSRKGKDKP